MFLVLLLALALLAGLGLLLLASRRSDRKFAAGLVERDRAHRAQCAEDLGRIYEAQSEWMSDLRKIRGMDEG